MKPAFIITIDTEGDDLWASSGPVTTRNARFLPRFQALCDRYGFKPVYLTDYDMGRDPVFIDFTEKTLSRNSCEIGMHLHAWSTPPEHTIDSALSKAYLVEYPEEVMRDKIAAVTELLRNRFGSGVLSHRAGRWAFDERYLLLLKEFGYTIDCSVTPGVALKNSSPESAYTPRGFEGFPHLSYEPALDDLSRPGTSGILEVPVTIGTPAPFIKSAAKRLPHKIRRRLLWPSWLRPNSGNLQEMIRLAKQRIALGSDYLEFMLHSSELMPGGSPYFPDVASIEKLYTDLDALFSFLAERTVGATLSEYRTNYYSPSRT